MRRLDPFKEVVFLPQEDPSKRVVSTLPLFDSYKIRVIGSNGGNSHFEIIKGHFDSLQRSHSYTIKKGHFDSLEGEHTMITGNRNIVSL